MRWGWSGLRPWWCWDFCWRGVECEGATALASVSAVVVAGNTQSASPAPPEVANLLLGTPPIAAGPPSKGWSDDTGPSSCPYSPTSERLHSRRFDYGFCSIAPVRSGVPVPGGG